MRLKPTLLLASLALSATGLMAPAALASGSTHDSLVTVEGVDFVGSAYTPYGEATSAKKCVANRKVRLYLNDDPGGHFRQVDTARTSANGTWAGRGSANTPPTEAKAVLVKSKFGPKHHRQTCSADQTIFILDK